MENGQFYNIFWMGKVRIEMIELGGSHEPFINNRFRR